ncbi:hypothetical protein Cpir12675_004567 [Ceratocystis pirilliformis]|uniref:Uncharacterized protein n=1 Tax=Ceratocystis pirilliformis TaxID=259994 RepID=A0ABR3YYL5_9PEZI
MRSVEVQRRGNSYNHDVAFNIIFAEYTTPKPQLRTMVEGIMGFLDDESFQIEGDNQLANLWTQLGLREAYGNYDHMLPSYLVSHATGIDYKAFCKVYVLEDEDVLVPYTTYYKD